MKQRTKITRKNKTGARENGLVTKSTYQSEICVQARDKIMCQDQPALYIQLDNSTYILKSVKLLFTAGWRSGDEVFLLEDATSLRLQDINLGKFVENVS